MTRQEADRMLFLDEPIPFRAHGRDCIALVVDGRMVFARFFARGRAHLRWIEKPSIARRLGVR